MRAISIRGKYTRAVAVAIIVFLLVAVVVGMLAARESARRRELIARIVTLVEGTVEGTTIHGRRRGQPLSYRLTSRGAGKSRVAWTEVDVEIPPVPFSLELRHQSRREERLAERGLAVDVVTGDPQFDGSFIVEAAPAAIAVRVLDAQVRARLLRLAPVAVKPLEGGRLRFEKTGHNLGLLIEDLVDVAAMVAAGIRPAVAADQEAVEGTAPVVGDPFRAQVDAGAIRATERARDEELSTLGEVKLRRKTHDQQLALVVAVVIVALFAVVFVMAAGR
jgi:hypothetical protein